MKKFGIIIITAVTVLAMSSLTGCGISFERPSKDGSVSSSENASISDKVENIRVEWVDGKVEFKRHDKDTVDLSEEIKGSGKAEKMNWRMEGTTLIVRYNEGTKLWSFKNTEKDLTVTLPKDLELDELEVATVSGDVTGDDLKCKNISMAVTSGDIDITQNGSTEKIEIATVSGNLDLKLDRFNKLQVAGTSADVNIYVPEDTGMTVRCEHVSGDFDSEIGMKKDGGIYTAGSGDSEVEIEAVTGDVNIYKRK